MAGETAIVGNIMLVQVSCLRNGLLRGVRESKMSRNFLFSVKIVVCKFIFLV